MSVVQVGQDVATGLKSGYVELTTGFKWCQRYLPISPACKVLTLGLESAFYLFADTTLNVMIGRLGSAYTR